MPVRTGRGRDLSEGIRLLGRTLAVLDRKKPRGNGNMTTPTKSHKVQPRKRPRSPRATQRPDALAFTVEGFQALGGPGKTSIYELAKAGRLTLFKDELGRTLIDGDSAREYLLSRNALAPVAA
jgi:hypothetical protein